MISRRFAGLLLVLAMVLASPSALAGDPEQPQEAAGAVEGADDSAGGVQDTGDQAVPAVENAVATSPDTGTPDGAAEVAPGTPADAPQSGSPDAAAQSAPGTTPETTRAATAEEDLNRARELAGEAGALYESGQYAEAIVKFNQALELYKHPVIYFNLAKAYEKLANYEQAAEAYRQYLTLHQEQTGAPAPDQADTERTIEVLREKAYMALPEVSIDSDPRGAEVYIDGADVLNGQTPMKIHLPEGTHNLVIRLAGFQMVQRDFEVRSREPARFTFSMIQEKNSGGILVNANIRGARIHIDGRVVGVTPMLQPMEVDPGRHQIMVEKDDYNEYSAIIDVAANQVSEVAVSIHLTRKSFSWRGSLGLSSMIIGAGVVGASVWGRYYINEGYKDQGMYNVVAPNAVSAQPFDTYRTMVYAGYGVGATLVGLGLGLLIWEIARKPLEIRDEDRIENARPSISVVPAVGPNMMGIGAAAVF